MQLNQVELQLERVLEAINNSKPRVLEPTVRESTGLQDISQARRGLTQRLEGIERAVDENELLLEGSLEVRGNRRPRLPQQPTRYSAAPQIDPTPGPAYSVLGRPRSPPQLPRRSPGQTIRDTAALMRHLGSEEIGRRPGRPMTPPQPQRGPERLPRRESAVPSRFPFLERIGGPSWR